MAIEEKKRTCFVVMPFGEKKDADGEEIDFDDIYRFFFRKAIEGLGLECIRCDEIAEAGSIHEKMFEQLYKADVAVVDITSLNANVFYELGIRHSLAKSVTVLIRRKGTMIPFNIQGLQVVEYDQKKFASIERAKERILDIIKNGLAMKKNDSPVHAVLSLNIGTEPKPINDTKRLKFPLINSKKSICLITGDLQKVTDIDIWVNPENTNMKMARPLDNSVSGIIRYLGSKREGSQVEDIIANELKAYMESRGLTSVDAGEVIVTSSGNLAKTHHVKMILHVAAFIGQFGKGYFPIPDPHECVENALRKADEQLTEPGNASILFPLMGTGTASRDFEEKVNALLEAAINYLNNNSLSKIESVYFLNYSDKELDVCQELLKLNPKVAANPEPMPTNELGSKPANEPEVKPGPTAKMKSTATNNPTPGAKQSNETVKP